MKMEIVEDGHQSKYIVIYEEYNRPIIRWKLHWFEYRLKEAKEKFDKQRADYPDGL